MSDRGFEVEVEEGIPVRLPSGATFPVVTESEREYVNERVGRYMTDNHFCVPSGTRIATQRGGVPVEQIRVDDLVWSLTDNGFELRPQILMPAAAQPVITIKTENRQVRCSPNHKLLAWVTRKPSGRRVGNRGRLPNEYVHDWVEAQDIERGLPLVQAAELAVSSGKTIAPNGRELNEDFMEFLGFFLGDGTKHGSGKHVRISKKVDVDATSHYIGVLRQLTGQRGYESLRYVEVVDVSLVDELRDLGFWHRSVDRYVPEWIHGLTADLRRAFLRGYLDSDGFVSKAGRITFQASSEELVHGVWALCLSLAVAVAPIRRVVTTHHDAWRFMAGDPAMNKSIGTWDSRYQERLVNARPARGKAFIDRHGRFLPAPRGCEHSRVREIGISDPEPLWDLHVEGTHNFVADGVVVHNTNVSDLQDIDKMVTFELFMHRWSMWMSKGVNYWNDQIDEKVLSQQLNAYSTELRQLKKNLGIDKVNRDRQRGDDSVAAYLDNLRTRAKEFGVMRNQQAAKSIELFQQLKSLLTFYDNADDTERRENGVTMDELIDWIRSVAIPEFDLIDSQFIKDKQSSWIRKQ